MNDKRPTPDPSAGRRKRTAPTIDLEAEEVRSAEAASESVAPAAEAQAATEDEALSQAAAEAAASSEPSSAPSGDDIRKTKRPSPIVPAAVGGLVGAAVIALIGVIAWTAGLVPNAGSPQSDPRVAALETQLKDLQSRAATPSADAAGNAAVSARIGKLEDQIQKVSSSSPADAKALSDRVAANDSAMKSLGVALAALNRRYDELAASTKAAQARAEAAEKAAADLRGELQTVSRAASAGASSADLAPLQQRITALEDQTKNANAELARTTRSERAARLALSTAALRDAVLRGVPFAEELAQAKALGADEKSLAPLWPLAAGGVPTAKDLASELNDLLPQLQKAAGSPAASGSFLDRLQANAESLVRIRPAGAPPGDDTSAVLARLETDAMQGNIDAALAEIGKLPEAARQKASGWVTRAVTRQKALAAARDVAADSTRSLGSR
ncbi:MAG: hypothetical protein JSR61_11085 [Proteobacteria bacterium]|nr:hypothetical protein [Pseudomonadota bacterium]